MVRRHRQLYEKNIQTILEQLQKRIATFDFQSQNLLTEFLSCFLNLNNSDELFQRISEYEGKYLGNSALGYFDIPFLWFSVDFCQILKNFFPFLQANLQWIQKTLREMFLFIIEHVIILTPSR